MFIEGAMLIGSWKYVQGYVYLKGYIYLRAKSNRALSYLEETDIKTSRHRHAKTTYTYINN